MTSFTAAYAVAVWKALVAALLISAALQSLVPRRWLLGVLNRRGRVASAVAGGLCSTPSMMCTCCTAPVAVTLRRSGVSTPAALAYWLGNPLLNPAVLVFLLFVAPWQWTVTRLVVGLLVVVGGAALVARVTDDGRGTARADTAQPTGEDEPEPAATGWCGSAPARFGRALLRLSIVLVPEYVLVVMLIGAFRGWLFPLGATMSSGLLVVVIAAVVGTLLVIPTAGEIPILQGLAIAGVAAGPIAALLIHLAGGEPAGDRHGRSRPRVDDDRRDDRDGRRRGPPRRGPSPGAVGRGAATRLCERRCATPPATKMAA